MSLYYKVLNTHSKTEWLEINIKKTGKFQNFQVLSFDPANFNYICIDDLQHGSLKL